ncbi:MAG: hypothetical protein ACI4AK_00505 [Lepagella sp.]
MTSRLSLSAAIFLVTLLTALPGFAADPVLSSSGTWGRTTITGNEVVTLTGDVSISDAVEIAVGGSLTIYGAGHRINARNYDETALAGNNPGGGNTKPISFLVRGTLKIYGEEGNPLDIAGAATVNYGYDGLGNDPSFQYANQTTIYDNYQYAPEHDKYVPEGTDKLISYVIDVKANGASLVMEHVNIHDCRGIHYFNYGTVLDIGGDGSGNPISVSLKDVNIYNCMSTNGRGVINVRYNAIGTINFTDCTISNSRTYGYGGVLVGVGGGSTSNVQVTFDNCEMHHCISSGWGGAILWACTPANGSKLILKNSRFHHNYARCLGGAISNEGETHIENCIIEDNFAGYGGGGIASFPFTHAGSDSGDANGIHLGSGNIIRNNKTLHNSNLDGKTGRFGAFKSDVEYPSGGGGVWILMNKSGWTCNSVIGSGNEISSNSSANTGGGVMLFKSDGNTTSLTSAAVIRNNTALSGGGIAIGAENVSELPSMTINGGEISDNTATSGNGGGVYMPGGIFSMTAGSVARNYAFGNGGGFSITNGTVSISGTADISENNCSNYGAGLYVNNTGSSTVSTSFEGGVVKNNGATACLAGGGICVEGNVDFSTTASIENNTARNGGGICVIGGGKVTYKKGLIRENKASSAATYSTYTTGYLKGVNEIQGFGGGIFVADAGSQLKFDMSGTSIGVYDNIATNGADDIFANGNSTTVIIPNVKGMTLTDFRVPVAPDALFWAEDYVTNDPNYNLGTNINTSWSGSSERYRDALAALHSPYRVVLADSEITKTLTCYTSLALGYEILFATIEKEGLKKGESAIFEVKRAGDSSTYCRVILTGVDDAGTMVSRRVALIPGDWKVCESAWSWAYTADRAEQTLTIKEGNPNTFSFKNTDNTDIPRGEDVKTNILKK